MTTHYPPTEPPTEPPIGFLPNGHRRHGRAATGTPLASAVTSPLGSSAGDRLPTLSRPRRPARAVAGALLVIVCAVTSVAIATASNHRIRVLALAHDVQAGQVFAPDDLTVTQISGAGIKALGAATASSLVGQTVT